MVLAETWHGHCPSYISPNSEPIFMKLFLTQRGYPEPFENESVQPEPNCGITTCNLHWDINIASLCIIRWTFAPMAAGLYPGIQAQ